jgi:hypothetical protein
MTAQTAAVEARAVAAPRAARITAALSVLAVFLLARPYFGIRHDARIYVGRAEADLGRNGMANDLMFAHDGQSKFSIFGSLFRPLVEHLGSAQAALLATMAGLAFWLAAAAFLASRFCRGAAWWAALVALAALPAFYVGVLAYGEPFITPRMFAEGLVCLSLALALDRRWIAGGGLMLLAAALHPIMTAPAVAAFGLMLALQDRRWLILAGLAAGAALAAAFAGLPLIERLVIPMDPAWLQMLQQRSAYLFPSLWSASAWAMLARQSVTLAVAASFLPGRTRALALVVLTVGAAGVLISVLAPTVLIVQLQLWRGQWMVALLSTALLPFVLAQLWRDGPGGRLAAALLAVAWGAADPPLAGPAAAALALALRFVPQARALPPLAWRAGWAVAGLLLARAALVAAVAAVANTGAPGADGLIVRMLYSEALGVIAVALAVAAILRHDAAGRIAARPWAVALAALLLVAGACVWDAQSDWTRARDSSAGAAALRAQLPPGEIFWLGGDGRSGPWTGRPEWWSVNEGASSVFDRTLALEWRRRHQALVRAGLSTPKLEMVEVGDKPRPILTRAALDMVCRTPRGPAAIVAPAERTAPDLRPAASLVWRAPASPSGKPADAVFLVFPCVGTSARPG